MTKRIYIVTGGNDIIITFFLCTTVEYQKVASPSNYLPNNCNTIVLSVAICHPSLQEGSELQHYMKY